LQVSERIADRFQLRIVDPRKERIVETPTTLYQRVAVGCQGICVLVSRFNAIVDLFAKSRDGIHLNWDVARMGLLTSAPQKVLKTMASQPNDLESGRFLLHKRIPRQYDTVYFIVHPNFQFELSPQTFRHSSSSVSIGFQRAGYGLEVHTQWVNNKASRFSSLSTPR
jgi:hypothetical protein